MVGTLKSCSVQMFADDTLMYAMGRSPDEVVALLNEDLRNVKVWLRNNSIVTNYAKTKVMFLGEGKGTLLNSHSHTLEEVSEIKLLGT